MTHRPPLSPHSLPAGVREQAALWLARRDRGLSPVEQDEYLQWLQADPRHAEAVTQHAAALERMMQLYEWQPAHDSEPNPDLFLPRRRFWAKAGAVSRRRGWLWSGALAAAALAVAFLWERPWSREAPAVTVAAKSYLRVNERLALPDGSRVELKDGSQVVVLYSGTERRVKLTGGEAHFSVWKDAARPFVVDAAGVEVRAVGTAFNVRLEDKAVEVLVTEGRVRVDDAGVGAVAPNRPAGEVVEGNGPYRDLQLLFVSQGERAVVPLAAAAADAAPVVTPVTAEDISQELAWQAPRLQFNETPLADAIAEFNRLNRHQLLLGDAALGAVPIGGTFRPDNVEGFIRLLDTTLGIQGEQAGDDTTVLRRER